MKVGIAGPVDMAPLLKYFKGDEFPRIYSFPLISSMILELKKRGHVVTIFCGSDEVSETQWVQGDGLLLCITPRRKKRMPYNFYKQEREFLVAAMNQSDCDLIHAHWTYDFGAAAVASNKPSLVTAHDATLNIWPFMMKRGIWFYWSMHLILGIKVAHQARYLSAVSPYVAQHIERWFWPKHHILVTPNGIREDQFILFKLKGTENVAPVVCSVLTGWGKLKNPKSALKAFMLIRKKYPLATYRIFGAGYEVGGPAHTWAKARGLDVGVDFCGKVPFAQLIHEISTSFVFLHPSLEEAHPMAICEAMSLGIPVVGGARSGGVPFTLNHGVAGVLVDVRSPSAIAEAVLELLNDRKKRDEVAKSGYEFAKKEFTVSKMMDRYEEAYSKILRGTW